MTVLQTARLVLRPLGEGDLPALAERINDIEIARWLSVVPFPYSLANAEAFLAHVQSGAERAWVIDDGAFCGIVGLGDEFGYWLARHAWGQGFATEAGRAVLGWHFRQPGANDVVAGHAVENLRSARVLEKLGFEPTGLSRSFYLARGAEADSRRMLLTRERWERLSIN